MGKEGILLEDHADVAFFRRDGVGWRGHSPPREEDFAGLYRLKPRDGTKNCGFAAPGWSKQTENFTFTGGK